MSFKAVGHKNPRIHTTFIFSYSYNTWHIFLSKDGTKIKAIKAHNSKRNSGTNFL